MTESATDLLLVSGFIRQRPGAHAMKHSISDYLRHFQRIVDTGLPIVLFLDRTLIGEIAAPNVTVVPVTLAELPAYRIASGEEMVLPAGRDEARDTADYLTIMNAKPELAARAAALNPAATCIAWVDFGLFHCISDVPLAQERLQRIRASADGRVTIPGCWEPGDSGLDEVNWRFCGGLFWGTPDAIQRFASAHERAYRALLPHLTWEVNVWAWMEAEGSFHPHWYAADHDDRILAYPGAIEGIDQSLQP